MRVYLGVLVLALVCSLLNPAVAADESLMPRDTREHVERALVASYVEGDTMAGFGAYPLYRAGRPCLYTTYGCIEIIHRLAPSRLNADALAEWIRGLQTERGGFFDPEVRGNVPEWWQTRWACWSLALLDRSPADPVALLDFLLSFRLESGLFQYDPSHSSVADMERDSADVAELLMSPFFRGLAEADHAIAALADYAVKNLSVLSSVESTPMTIWGVDEHDRKVWGLLQLVCLLLPDQVPESARSVLRLALENPPAAGADFYTAASIYSLLRRAHGITPALEFDLEPVLDYLSNGIEPVIEPLGGFGGTGALGGGWIDPAATWATVGLYDEAGIPYPFETACLESIDRYAHPQGWIEIIHVFPRPFATWEAIQLSQYGGLRIADEGKLLAYGESVLADPHSDLDDLYYAALIVGSVADAVPDVLAERIETMSLDELVPQADLLVQIADAFPQSLGDRAQAALRYHLGVCAENLDRLSVDRLWDLIVLQPILGEEYASREALLGRVTRLAYEGGYRYDVDVPAPSLASTQLAVDCLARLDALDRVTQILVRQYVEDCRTDIGYVQRSPAHTPGDAQREYLHHVLEAMQILDLLDQPDGISASL
jgi:prenyltransferase beta subunit